MNRRILLLTAAGLLAVTGCQTRDKAVVPNTVGTVLDYHTGAPAAEAVVSAIEVPVSTRTGPEGAFSLEALTRSETDVVLPASGVYIARAPLKATTGTSRAYGYASFLSMSDTADQPVAFFLLPADAPYPQDALPEDCIPTDEERYALQALEAGPSATVSTWLEADMEHPYYFENLLDDAIGGLGNRCRLTTASRLEWNERIEAFIGEDG
ncbi:hypothetical protein [Henriciella sp.]|uniref:hypothetical protein n=1 Tax=Henriciella sp. TaxID=1968823 RepID=UPI00262AD75A|nr:hypothetical protein [Henriciella sp.]